MLIINANFRSKLGKGASRRLRNNNEIPAIIYGKHCTPMFIKLNFDKINEMEKNVSFYDKLILLINNEKINVKIQEVQRHPFKLKLIHIDFLLL